MAKVSFEVGSKPLNAEHERSHCNVEAVKTSQHKESGSVDP